MKCYYIERILYEIKKPFEYIKALKKISTVYENILKNESLEEPITVVFLVPFIPTWNKVCYLYLEMLKSNMFNPIIFCVPFDTSKYDDDKLDNNDVYDYFIKNNYNAINALNSKGEWVNIEKYKPKYIICTKPYNYYLPMCYRSQELSKYSLVCNILYGESLSNSIGKNALNFDFYKDVFCYFAFDDSEKEYYKRMFRTGIKRNVQRCEALGRVGLEYILNQKHKKRSTRRKVIWTPRWSNDKKIGGSNFFKYKEAMLILAKKYHDIDFVFRPHPLMFNNFIEQGIMTKKQKDDYICMCNNIKNITFDDSAEYIDMFWESDLLISDFSSLLIEYFITSKPIFYCEPSINIEYNEIGKKILSCSTVVKNEKELFARFEEWYSQKVLINDDAQSIINDLEIDGCASRIMTKLIEFLRK